MGDHRREIESAKEHLLHLVPSLPHAASGDSFDGQSVEDHIRPVDLGLRGQDTELRDVRTFVHMLDHVVEGRGCTGHLQTHIETTDTELEHRILDRLAFGAIDGKGSTHFLGNLQTERVDVGDDDVLRSGITTDTCRHRADESCSCDEHILAQQRESQSGVRGVAERIHDSREIIGNTRMNAYDVRFGHRDELCETTVTSHDTKGDRVLTDMPHTSTAVTAVSARNMSFRRHTVAYLEIANTGTAVCYNTHELMSHGVRRFAVCLRPCVPLIHMQIRSADSGFGDFDQDIIDAHFRHRDIFHPDAGLWKSLD